MRDYKYRIEPLGSKKNLRLAHFSRTVMLSSIAIASVVALMFLPDESEPVRSAVADSMIETELVLSFADETQQQPSKTFLPALDAEPVSLPLAIEQTDKVQEKETIEPVAHSPVANPVPSTVSSTVSKEDINNALDAIDPAALSWQTVKVKSGDSMARIFRRAGLSASELHAIMQSDKKAKKLRNINPGQKIRLATGADGKLQQLEYKINEITTLSIHRELGGYRTQLKSRQYETRIAHAAGTIHQSLFLAGMEAGLTDSMTMDLAGIFGWDIDFALDIRSGDRFVVVYEEKFLDGRKVRDGNILAAEFINNNKTYRSIRFTNTAGRTGFYDENGHSMRKAFLRTPVDFSRISSRFSSGRKHPVLNRIRAHKGVDYAASRGTPIRATGDGKIIYRGRKGGYGKTVVIRHGSRYTTLYAHLNNYNRKARLGTRVKQGQIIGYVGSTGLATGPHLHYEFRLNGVHRNPLTVRLPKSESLAKKYMKDFKQQAAPLLAKLDTLSRTLVAMSSGTN